MVSWGVKDCVTKGAYSVFTKVTTYVGAAYAQFDDSNLSYDRRQGRPLPAQLLHEDRLREGLQGHLLRSPRVSWGNWSGVNLVRQTDLNRDGFQDLGLPGQLDR